MFTRYDLIHDINCASDCAMMWKTDSGEYVLAEEAYAEITELKEKQAFLVKTLLDLKACNVKLTPPEELNSYVDTKLMGFL